jgi:hypothetical protein
VPGDDSGDSHQDIRTEDLRVGDPLYLDDDSFTYVAGKQFFHRAERAISVGLTVDGDHCYLIGRTHPRVLTHNNEPDIT